jgi:hypothetical protein
VYYKRHTAHSHAVAARSADEAVYVACSFAQRSNIGAAASAESKLAVCAVAPDVKQRPACCDKMASASCFRHVICVSDANLKWGQFKHESTTALNLRRTRERRQTKKKQKKAKAKQDGTKSKAPPSMM